MVYGGLEGGHKGTGRKRWKENLDGENVGYSKILHAPSIYRYKIYAT